MLASIFCKPKSAAVLSECSGQRAASQQQTSEQDTVTSTSIQQLQDENLALRDALEQMSELAMPAELASNSHFQVSHLHHHLLEAQMYMQKEPPGVLARPYTMS